MRTWNGLVKLSRVNILGKDKLRIVATSAMETATIVTPGQAMRLANMLRRWAMGNIRRAPAGSLYAAEEIVTGKD